MTQLQEREYIIGAGALAGATGLEVPELGARRIQVDDKQIINCRADLNQLVLQISLGLG